jgi:hypothetical protein
MSLHYLLYESHATRRFTEPDLWALLKEARHFNSTQGLTGLLLYTTDGRFVQVLEGEADSLAKLYERISQDPRHERVRLLAHEPLSARRFGDWHMGFRRLSAAALDEVLGHVDTHNAAFLLPLLPVLSNALLDKLLDHVHG